MRDGKKPHRHTHIYDLLLLLLLPVTIWAFFFWQKGSRSVILVWNAYKNIINITTFFAFPNFYAIVVILFGLVMWLVSWSSHWFYEFEWVCFCVSCVFDNVLIIHGFLSHTSFISFFPFFIFFCLSFCHHILSKWEWWAFIYKKYFSSSSSEYSFNKISANTHKCILCRLHRKQQHVVSRLQVYNYRYVNWIDEHTSLTSLNREHIEMVFQLFFTIVILPFFA